jgi:cytochrome c-type biogenesis protein CcmH/NrfG
MISGTFPCPRFLAIMSDSAPSFDPAAEKTCEDLLASALQTDPGNAEALQALASVRMSQQRPDEAKQCLEQAWSAWKDLDLGQTP